jgi:hypothetical protein
MPGDPTIHSPCESDAVGFDADGCLKAAEGFQMEGIASAGSG